jgi:hypothetical protein
MQYFLEVYPQEFEILKFLLDADEKRDSSDNTGSPIDGPGLFQQTVGRDFGHCSIVSV